MMAVEDKLAIMDVLIRYATGIDRRDWALFRTCFTDDFTGEYGAFGTWTSGDAITEAMIASHAPVGLTLHRLSNMAIEESAKGALARTYVDAVLMPQDRGGMVHQATGFYDDELVKVAGQWKIANRRFTMARLQQTAEPMV